MSCFPSLSLPFRELRVNFRRYFLSVFFLFAVFSCSYGQGDSILVANVSMGVATSMYSQNALRCAFELAWGDGTVVNSVTIDKKEGKWLLIGTGFMAGNSRLKAFVLVQHGNQLFYSISQSAQHNCRGNGCSECQLKSYTDNDGIVHYWCDCIAFGRAGGYCDHDIIGEEVPLISYLISCANY